MAATGYTPIQLYYSSTASNVPVNTNLAFGELALNIVDGKLYYKDNSSVVQLLSNAGVNSHLTWDNTNTTLVVNTTGSLDIPVGTTAQRPATSSTGMVRYNTSLSQFEGYNGTLWGGIGGAQGGGAISVNNKTVTVSYTITATQNGFSVGPITLAPGVTVTTAPTSRWVIT